MAGTGERAREAAGRGAALADRGQPAVPTARTESAAGTRLAWPGVWLDLAAAALFLVLPALRFWRLFTPYPPDQLTLAEGDFNVEFFPLARAISAIVHAGEWPLWNPWSDAGQPLLADPQSAVWYPLNWIVPWLVRGNDPASLVAYELHTVYHLFLAALFMYLLGRQVIGSRLGALVAALTFAYSGLMTAYPIQQVPILRTAVWMPLLLVCLVRAFERGRWACAVAGGLLLGVDILAGHPQLLLFQLYGLTLYVAYRLWEVWPDRGALARTVGLYALFGAIGFGLASVQWFPSLEFMRLSDRATADYAFTAVGFSPYELLLDMLAPRIIGGLPPYVGILPLVLAVLAVRFVRDRRLPYFVLLAALGLVVSLGGNSFFHSVLYLVGPGYGLFQHQERAIYLYTLAMAVLAGYGAAWLARPHTRRERTALGRLGAPGLAALLAALLVGGMWYVGNLFAAPTTQALRWREVIDWYNWFVLMLVAALGLVALRQLWRRGRRLVLAALPGVILLDLFTVSWTNDMSVLRPDQLFIPSEIVQFIHAEPGLFRVSDHTVLNGNHGLVYLVPTVQGTYGMFVARFITLRDRLPRERFWELLNVRYVLTREEPPAGWQVVLTEQFQQYLNRVVAVPNPLPRALIVPRARVVADEEAQLAILAAPEFDPRAEVLLAAPPPAGWTPATRPGRATVRRYGATALEVEVEADGGFLLLSEIDYPGWRAYVDGVERPILRANYALRAVALQPGDRLVRLSYEPDSLRLGAMASGATLLVAVALLVGSRAGWAVRRRKARG